MASFCEAGGTRREGREGRLTKFAPFPEWKWEIPEFFNIGVACTDAHLGTSVEDRVAMIVEDDILGTSSITYKDLAQRAGRFAQHLADLGVRAGERVLVRLPNSIDYPTAFLGAMKRGAIAVPTSTLLTADEVRYLVEDSGAAAIVIDKAGWESIGARLKGAGKLRHVILGGDELASKLAAIGSTEPAHRTR